MRKDTAKGGVLIGINRLGPRVSAFCADMHNDES